MCPAGIIPAMTERGLPSADGSPACPFVAFEDERDERADRPDHRHRCYAEPAPAPRALAHQEAYCLSSAFPVCPTFQEWARREAAHARAGGTAAPTPAGATVAAASSPRADCSRRCGEPPRDPATEPADDDPWSRPPDERPPDERPHRNPPRDWAAPPPWATGAAGALGASAAAGSGAAAAGAGSGNGPPDFLASREVEGRGLAGSAADRLASGEDLAAVLTSTSRRPVGRRPVIRRRTPIPSLPAWSAGGGAAACATVRTACHPWPGRAASPR